MASQIDVTGGIHTSVRPCPGNDSPCTRSRTSTDKRNCGRRAVLQGLRSPGRPPYRKFEQAEGGLVAGSTAFNADRRNKGATGFADPKVIPEGENQVQSFYLAGTDRIWHRATVKLEGESVVLHAPGVKDPRGVSYGTGGIGFQPNLYNRALLPMTPFIYYDHKRVNAECGPRKAKGGGCGAGSRLGRLTLRMA